MWVEAHGNYAAFLRLYVMLILKIILALWLVLFLFFALVFFSSEN